MITNYNNNQLRNLALSIRQPFVEQILSGEKTIEYRTIPTKIRGPVYIYASLKETDDNKHLKKGFILGIVDIVDCISNIDENNKLEYHWILKSPRRLKIPIKPDKKAQPVWFKPFKNYVE